MADQLRQFTANDLAEAAQRVGLSVQDLRQQLSKASQQALHGQAAELTIKDSDQPSCKDIDFDIKVFSFKGRVCFTPGTNWQLTFDLKLYLIGIELGHINGTLSASNPSICFNFDVIFGSVQVCFGVRGQRACLYTSGTACALGQCTSWDETIVCFG